MSKHTPGPWEVAGEFRVRSKADPDRGICSTGSYFDGRRDTEEQHRENMSNARLIAAAPDMLEALEEVYQAYEAPPEESADFDWDAWGRKAQDTLRRARGEE